MPHLPRSPTCRLPLPIFGLALLLAFPARAEPATIQAIGVENQYADVISQIGGRYVHATAIETDPNTDPHAFEASPAIARQIAGASLIVENGLGYDDWADKIIAAAPFAGRRLINVQHLLALPDSTPNPHLWYGPRTMPALADRLAADLAALKPSETGYFEANAQRFKASLRPWSDAIAALRNEFPHMPVAVTEPVANDMLQAAGADIETPFNLQEAIMNGTDPAPQDVSAQNALFTGRKVKLFAYNQQVTDSLTAAFLSLAKQNRIPVVGVYETMPAGFTYQGWMLAEVKAVRQAVSAGSSTESLVGAR